MASVFLGIDIGTTSAKALAVSDSGELLAFAQHPYGLSHPLPGWAEQDAEDYWSALVDVVRQVLDQMNRPANEVVSLALSTQGDTLILADAEGRPLAPAMSWMDNRADAECRELISETGESFWYHETGIRLTALSSACKIRWIARHQPELRQRVRRFCGVADFLALRLTGKLAADVPSASWTPCYSPRRRDWSRAVMANLLEVARESLPEVVESGAPIGELLLEVASELGLAPGTRLIAGAFDQAAAAHGAGVVAGSRSVLSCGTAWVLYAVTGYPIDDARERIPLCCHARPNEWGMVLPFPGGSVHEWSRRSFPEQTASARGDDGSLVFIPHLYGGLAPDWESDSRGSLLGLTMAHTPEEIRLAVIRGIASEARRNVEAAEEFCGKIPAIRMVGGASKSEIWPRMIANLLDRPVELSDFVESACYGAAKLAAGEVAANWPAPGSLHCFDPTPQEAAEEQRRYEKYLRFYEGLLPLYRTGGNA